MRDPRAGSVLLAWASRQYPQVFTQRLCDTWDYGFGKLAAVSAVLFYFNMKHKRMVNRGELPAAAYKKHEASIRTEQKAYFHEH